jgi:hypothetical protein
MIGGIAFCVISVVPWLCVFIIEEEYFSGLTTRQLWFSDDHRIAFIFRASRKARSDLSEPFCAYWGIPSTCF